MKVINISKDLNLVLETKRTKEGFKHVAILTDNFNEPVKASINYINRTWERFEYESVIMKLLEKKGYTYVQKEIVMNKVKTQL
jgi:hypothetical protein